MVFGGTAIFDYEAALASFAETDRALDEIRDTRAPAGNGKQARALLRTIGEAYLAHAQSCERLATANRLVGEMMLSDAEGQRGQ